MDIDELTYLYGYFEKNNNEQNCRIDPNYLYEWDDLDYDDSDIVGIDGDILE